MIYILKDSDGDIADAVANCTREQVEQAQREVEAALAAQPNFATLTIRENGVSAGIKRPHFCRF
ncbi:MAG: hypothetical protein P4L56_17475 [Candidatus Sulfopaludibacter sp.]|nr:hypothetical protein [Candidatus Sulfopaludibacter sp.]